MSGKQHDATANERTIKAPPQLDMASRATFCDSAVSVLEEMEPGKGYLVIDMSETHYIDTSAVGTLAVVQGKAAERRHTVKLRNANDEIRFTLLLARMNELFEMDGSNGR